MRLEQRGKERPNEGQDKKFAFGTMYNRIHCSRITSYNLYFSEITVAIAWRIECRGVCLGAGKP